MNADLRELVTFHLTGARSGADQPAPVEADGLRPALLARYGDLPSLRYDFPLVLVDGATEPTGFVRSLTDVVNGVLRVIAPPGIGGERLRKHLLRLDHEIRQRVAGGARGTLRHLWAHAERRLIAAVEPAGRDQLVDSLSRAQEALTIDGQVIDCCDQLAERLFNHAWAAVTGRLRRAGRARIERLLFGVRAILGADTVKSAAGRTPDKLAESMGSGLRDAFDFGALSQLLTATASTDLLPERRRRRLEQVVATLEGQRFFPAAGAAGYDFLYADADAALAAFEERLPAMVALVEAMAIAELELDNRYREAKHDDFFTRFDATSLVAEDFAGFPAYLVVVRDHDLDAAAKARLIELAGSLLPIKVVVQTEEILDGNATIGGKFALGGGKTVDLARLALGLGSTFVLQAPASSLYSSSDAIGRGLSYAGPALFSIYSGAARAAIPAYLASAAAMQSRAFPAFTYDPGAGTDWASRFSIADNPAVDLDWATAPVVYEDDDLQRVSAEVAFTFVDFLACDPRYAAHLAVVPRNKWVDQMVPAGDYLAHGGSRDQVPYLWMVGADDRIHRVVVDARAIRAAKRCVETWHSLQELGGVHNSHAERSLARAREVWAEEKQKELAELKSQLAKEQAAPAAAAPPAAGATPAEPTVAAAPTGPIEKASIDTSRCTTCNECTNRNNKLFVYNENKQAMIGDLSAGTYRQMVEAAEACKVAIIHPGKPWNLEEVDLDALMARAAPFN